MLAAAQSHAVTGNASGILARYVAKLIAPAAPIPSTPGIP
jgi:hypothetical protein